MTPTPEQVRQFLIEESAKHDGPVMLFKGTDGDLMRIVAGLLIPEEEQEVG